MRLHLSVARPGGDGSTTVSVSAPAGTRLGDVIPHVGAVTGLRCGWVRCGGRDVPPEALLGVAPLLHGALLEAVDLPSPDTPTDGRVGVEVRVTSGPDAGRVTALGPGWHTVGREDCDVLIDDPQVSRLHVALHVGPVPDHPVTVLDRGSTNGVVAGGTATGRDERHVPTDEVVVVGATTFMVAAPVRVPVSWHPDGAGLVLVNRPPHPRSPCPADEVRFPAPPAESPPGRPPVVALLLPLLAGIGLAAFTGMATYLLFVLLSPLMLLGSWLGDRVAHRRTRRVDTQRYAREVAAAERTLAGALRREATWLRARSPDLTELMDCARGHRPGLWRRRPVDDDFLLLRLGLGRAAAQVRVEGRGGGPIELLDVPVTVSLVDAGVLGVTGPGLLTDRLVRALLAQVTAWHSPRDLDVVVLAPDESWAWTRWLPHVQRRATDVEAGVRLAIGVAEVGLIVTELLRAIGEAVPPRRTVVLVAGTATLRAVPEGARLLAEGPAAGVHLICADRDQSALPFECGATVEVLDDGTPTLRLVDADGTTHADVVLDGVRATWAEDYVRTVAPLRDAAPNDQHEVLPSEVRLLDLLPVDATDSRSVTAAWRREPRSTRVPLGVLSGGESFVLDLAGDGPHVLVAGTTGSGKSELLQSLVAALAVGNRPDQLALVLVDYKGGAAFRECAALPHTVGLVTDLDSHLTARALQSLEAELRHRERVLRDADVSDFATYVRNAPDRRSRPDRPVPRLVIVVDEFAALAEELPGFVGGLVGIAQRGRSLGVHLVLATQRPGGVVSADIRANTAVRLALRVSSPAESVDVLERPDAAGIPRQRPGRAVLRLGSDDVCTLQLARVSGLTSRRGADEIDVRLLAGNRTVVPERPVAPECQGSDLAAIVAAVTGAAEITGSGRARSPWLAPLPDLVVASEALEGVSPEAPIGLADLPALQEQRPFRFALAGGNHLMVAGGPGSGRTTTLRTIAGQLARRHTSAELHLHAIDIGGGLAWLADLPQCGTVVGRHDPARADRLLQLLEEEMERRQHLLAVDGVSRIEERGADPVGDRPPYVVLLVDAWEGVLEMFEPVDHGRPVQRLERLVREGAATGFRLVVAGGRAVVTSRVGAGIRDRVLLRFADPGDLALAGVPRERVPRRMPAGRALVGPQAVETQMAVLGADASGAGQQAGLALIAERARASERTSALAGERPLRLRPLPAVVTLAELHARAGSAPERRRHGWVPLGLGGDDARPLGLDLSARAPAVVVAGPRGSGRSTALVVAARWCAHRGRPVAVVAPARSSLRGLAGQPGVVGCAGPDDVATLRAALTAHPDAVVLADDAELLQDTAVEPMLLAVLRGAPEHARASVVLAGTTHEMASAFRGVAAEARKAGTGVLLGPMSPVDGDLLGVRVPRMLEAPAGRGVLVESGRVTPVQVACAN